MTEAKSQIREELKNLDRLAVALEGVYGPDCTAQMIFTLGAGRLLGNGATPAAVAGALRLLAEQVEEAHGVSFPWADAMRLAQKGARAEAGSDRGIAARVADGAVKKARVLAYFEDLRKSASVSDAIAAAAAKFGLSAKRVRQMTADLRGGKGK
jgi:hypothetical protein